MEISNKEIIENIEKLGLSNYEARAYVCLYRMAVPMAIK